jgi:hypothetical protein
MAGAPLFAFGPPMPPRSCFGCAAKGSARDRAHHLLVDFRNGITHNEHLLEHAKDPHKRNELLKHLGVDSAQMTEWTNRADLMRLKGVSTEMANLLEECGVDSCKELQHRKADHLHAKLHEINDTKKIAHHVPPRAQVEAWIKEAAQFAAKD